MPTPQRPSELEIDIDLSDFLTDRPRQRANDPGIVAIRQGDRRKLSDAGKFLPWFGDAVGFPLIGSKRLAAAEAARNVAAGLGNALTLLDPSALHLTIHELVSGAALTSQLNDRMGKNLERCAEIFSHLPQGFISLRCAGLTLLRGRELALTFHTEDPRHHRTLVEVSHRFDALAAIGFVLRPVLVIGHLRTKSALPENLRALQRLINAPPFPPFVWQVAIEDLAYLRFRSMNDVRAELRASDVGSTVRG